MKVTVVKTSEGWEPAFWDNQLGEYVVEPGFAKPTRKEAQEALRRDLERCRAIDAQSRSYAAGLDYACGYRD